MTPPQFIRIVRMIHAALVIGVVTFLVIACAMVRDAESDGQLNPVFLIVLGAMAVTAPLAGHVVFRALCQRARSQAPLHSRLTQYQTALLMRWATIEAPCLFAGVLIIVEKSYIYAAICLVLLFFFTLTYPSLAKLIDHLGLEGEERDAILSGKALE